MVVTVPRICVEISEIDECITRPVNTEIVRAMLKTSGIDVDNTRVPVRYMGEGLSVPQHSSTISDDLNDNRLIGDSQITIEVNEEYVENSSSQHGVLCRNRQSIFSDKKLGVSLYPVYQTIKSEIRVTYRASDRVVAEQWRRAVKTRATRGGTVLQHQVSYHYPIPVPEMVILLEIHRLRENTMPYGDTVGHWLNACFSDKYTVISNLIGKGQFFAIRENQTGIFGQYDFTITPPKEERDTDTGPRTVSFTYTFQYDRVEAVTMVYPLVVHNQQLSENYIDITRPVNDKTFLSDLSMDQSAMANFSFTPIGSQPYQHEPGLAIPYYDDWLVPSATLLPNMQNLLRVQLGFALPDKRSLINLEELGNYKLDADLITFLKERPIALTSPYDSILMLSLYRGNQFIDIKDLSVNGILDVQTISECDPRQSYHLCVSIVMDPTVLSTACLTDMAKHAKLFKKYLGWLNRKIPDFIINPDESISLPLVEKIIRDIKPLLPVTYPNAKPNLARQMHLSIIAHREE